MERLQKLLAHAGVASRRASEDLIVHGRVTVDGQVITELGAKADPHTSRIAVDGQPIHLPRETYLFALNKPPGIVSTRHDERGRTTIMHFIKPKLRSLVYPVGRLDMDSTGLILLTNDGELTHRLAHPSYHVQKTYVLRTQRPLTSNELDSLRRGAPISGGVTAPADVTPDPGDQCRLQIVLHEGRKRQIRRMLRALNNEVLKLHRIAFGPIDLGDLQQGQVRRLSDAEYRRLRQAVNLDT